MTNRDDLYILQDGTHADPADVSPGKDGVLRHKNGLAVIYRDDGVPMTVGLSAVDNKNVEAAEAGKMDADKPTEPASDAPASVVPAPEPMPAPESETPAPPPVEAHALPRVTRDPDTL